MGDEVKDIIMSHVRRDIMGSTLEKGVRFDGRKLGDFRPISIQRSVIKTAEGSAIARIGDTQVLVATSANETTRFALAAPVSFRRKVPGVIGGVVILALANLLRIVTLFPLTASPQILSRGKVDRSTSRTRRPFRAATVAAVAPAGPPPTMMASYRSIELLETWGLLGGAR